jgi:hypothetical protein
MNTKHLTLILALALAGTLNLSNLNAAESARSPKAVTNQTKCAAVTVADPNLLARNPDIAASPKVLANFPQLARGHKAQPDKPMAACTCCKR